MNLLHEIADDFDDETPLPYLVPADTPDRLNEIRRLLDRALDQPEPFLIMLRIDEIVSDLLDVLTPERSS